MIQLRILCNCICHSPGGWEGACRCCKYNIKRQNERNQGKHVNEKSEWKNVKNNMPRNYGFYLVWGSKYVRPQIMECIDLQGSKCFIDSKGRKKNVTYWANLIDLPKEE